MFPDHKLKEKLVLETELFNNQLNELLERNEQETGYMINEFKNKLSKELRVEYVDLKEIMDEEITIDLGQNLRSQLNKVFQILIKNGVRF